VSDPVLVFPRLRGVEFAFVGSEPEVLFADCQLAVALDELAKRLAARGVTRVNHVGTYNCRTIKGRDVLSLHGRGLAIDVQSVVDAKGRVLSVGEHWRDRDAGLLRDVARQLYDEFVFNIVLTPDYDAGHRDHLHLDLSEERHFMELGRREFLLGEQ
jgi:hypothetical protein